MCETASCVQPLKGDTFIAVAGAPVELSHSIKSLGVIIDENLTFDKHVRNVCKASYYYIRGLRHKIRETRQPTYLSELITDYIPSRSFRTSSANRLAVHTCHSSTGARSFRQVAAAVWNGLPVDIRLSNSIETFRDHLKKHLFNLS